MRVVVTASRAHTPQTMSRRLIRALLAHGAPKGKALTIIHGGAPGGDRVASDVAARWGANEYIFPAEWSYWGKKFAGPMRNAEMLKEMKPDYVIAFPTEASVGTWDCVTRAHQLGIAVYVYGEEK